MDKCLLGISETSRILIKLKGLSPVQYRTKSF
ncbi:IS3 family transposase [Streptococcus sp. 1001175B_160314_H6]